MGGYGSTRWGWHSKKTQVEDCRRFSIKDIKDFLEPGNSRVVSWSRSGRVVSTIGYQVKGGEPGRPVAIRFTYTVTDRGGEATDYDYRVELTTTLTPWGTRRYWFICPLVKAGRPCARRVGVLYLPPGGRYFGCRHCYDLAYRSTQEQHESDGLYQMMAASMQAEYPGITPADARYLMDSLGARWSKPPPKGGYFEHEYARRRALLDAIDDEIREQIERELANRPNPRAHYLTAGDLCERSGLTPDDLARLGAARLLLPDTKDGRYRPKLAGWGRKLAALLAAGWELGELQAWARGRWSTDNPRAWPPDRAQWAG